LTRQSFNIISTLKIRSAFFLLLIFFAGSCFSQELRLQEKRSYLQLQSGILTDTVRKNDTTLTFHMKKSPWKAVLYSAVVPGLGQLYNETYWKVPVIAIAGGYLGYVILHNNSKFLDYRDSYSASITPENPNGDLNLKNYREFYRNQRDQFILYFGLFYLINLADAYVDAQLYDFNVSEKITLSPFRNGKLLDLKVRF